MTTRGAWVGRSLSLRKKLVSFEAVRRGGLCASARGVVLLQSECKRRVTSAHPHPPSTPHTPSRPLCHGMVPGVAQTVVSTAMAFKVRERERELKRVVGEGGERDRKDSGHERQMNTERRSRQIDGEGAVLRDKTEA